MNYKIEYLFEILVHYNCCCWDVTVNMTGQSLTHTSKWLGTKCSITKGEISKITSISNEEKQLADLYDQI